MDPLIVATLEQQCRTLRRQLQQKTKQLAEQRECIEQLKEQERQSLDRERERLYLQLDKLAQKDEEIATVRRECEERLQRESNKRLADGVDDSVQRELEEKRAEIESLRSSFEVMKREQIAERNAAIATARRDHDDRQKLEDERDRLYEEADAKDGELERLRGRVERLQRENDDVKEKLCVASIAAVEKSSGGTLALQLLNTMAYAAPGKIQADALFPELATGKRYIQLLEQHSLIERQDDTLNVPETVRLVARTRLRNAKKEAEHLERVLAAFSDDIDKMNVEHAVSVWEHANNYDHLVKKFHRIPVEIMIKTESTAKATAFLAFAEKSYRQLKAVIGEDHLDTLNMLNWIAFINDARANYSESLKCYKVLVEKREAVLGAHHPHTLGAMHNLAYVSYKLSCYKEASLLLEDVLEKRKELLGDEHVLTINTSNLLNAVNEHLNKE